MSKKKDDSLKQTKIEKTGDKTFNVHTARGDIFECNSKDKLSDLKNEVNIPQGNTFHGIGEKKPLICDVCQKIVQKVQGTWDEKFKKVTYKCNNCK